MVLSVMLPSCGMRTGGDTFTEKDIQRYLNLENEKGTFLRNLYLRRFYGFFIRELADSYYCSPVKQSSPLTVHRKVSFWNK